MRTASSNMGVKIILIKIFRLFQRVHYFYIILKFILYFYILFFMRLGF